MNIKNTDKLILDTLQTNCKQSIRKISKKLNIPITTLHQRIKKLEENGVIRGYVALVKDAMIGLPTTAIVLIEASHFSYAKGDNSTLLQKLTIHPKVIEGYLLSGGYDILLKIKGKNERDIGKFVMKHIRSIKGVDRTFTSMIVKIGKDTTKLAV